MSATIVLFPGVGADERLFQPLRASFPSLIVPPWPEPRATESLSAFAARVAEGMPRSAPLYVGGSSFGGMVALEVAALLRPRGVFLIGSARSPRGLVPFARGARVLARVLPASFFRPRRGTLDFVASRFGTLTPAQRDLFWSMASAKTGSFIKWCMSAILSWAPSDVSAPVHHIHGSMDRVIPLRLVQADRVVVGGGHLLTLTHPAEVEEFLGSVVEP